MKLWLILAVIGLVWWIMSTRSRPAKSSQPRAAATDAPAVEVMVPCVICALHVPVSEALVAVDGAYACCETHRRARNSVQ